MHMNSKERKETGNEHADDEAKQPAGEVRRPVSISASGMPPSASPLKIFSENIDRLRRNWSYPESPFLLGGRTDTQHLRYVSNAGSLKATLREVRLTVSVVKEGNPSIESRSRIITLSGEHTGSLLMTVSEGVDNRDGKGGRPFFATSTPATYPSGISPS